MPSSFELSSAGVLTGTATMGMTANFTVRVTGANGLSSTKVIALPIIPRLDPGHLDPSFGTGGKVTTNLAAGADDCGQAVAALGDGKILVAGYARVGATDDFALARYWPDGRLDTSFGTGGVVTTAIGSGNDYGRAIAINEGSGLIVVAGETWNGASCDFAVAVYYLDGVLHSGFGTGGKVVRSISGGNDFARAVRVQGDNKIVVAGETAGSSIDFAVMRLINTGDPDYGFGTAGVVTTDLGSGGNDRAYGLALQADGGIVVVGSTPGTVNDDFAVVRYLTGGALDAGFGGDGIVVTAIGSAPSVAKAVALQTNGRIVVAGDSFVGASDLAVVRYLTDGNLDPDFSGDGKAVTTLGSGSLHGTSVAVDSAGRIVAAGYGNASGSVDMVLVRHASGGGLDPAFGNAGIQVTPVGSGEDRAHGVAITPSGGIVAAGCAHNGTDFDFAVTGHAGLLVPDILVEDPAVPWVPLWSVDFGGVPFGSSASRQIRIRNVGTASLTGLGLSFGAGNATAFPVSALPTTSLAPGASLTLTASFVPTASGDEWAALSIASNDSDENPHGISFTGIGGYTPIEAWRFTYFGNRESIGDGLDTNDFDKDGCVNFLEYAMGGNPTVPDAGMIQPKVVMAGGRFGISFTCRADRPEVKYSVEMAPTLPYASWFLLARRHDGGLVQVHAWCEVIDPGGTVRTVTVFPDAGLLATGRCFLRVCVFQ